MGKEQILQAEDLKLKKEFFISSNDVDFTKSVKWSTLLNYMQEMAYLHANKFGFGYESLAQHNCFWVLSRLKLQMQELPQWEERITVETWSKGLNRLFAQRDFIIKRVDGCELGRATSWWLALDGTTRRPVRPQNIPVKWNTLEEHALDIALDKIAPQGEQGKTHGLQVRYNELDVNKHVNNTRYMEWVQNCYPIEFYENHKLFDLQLNFLAEARYNSMVDLLLSKDPDNENHHFVEGIDPVSGQSYFRASLEWKEE